MNTTTLQERLEQRADARLQQDMDAAFQPALSKCSIGYPLETKLRYADGTPVSASDAISTAKKALTEHYRRDYREREVKNFIDQIETMGEQLESVMSELS